MTSNTPVPANLLTELGAARDPGRYGGKAGPLARLVAAGLPVPDGVVVGADLAEGALDAAARAIADWATATRAPMLVCRSSAPAEDGTVSSFAGLFTSAFTAADPASVSAALTSVRASARSAAVASYAHARGHPTPERIAVLIQPALRPYASGVLALDLTHACPATPGEDPDVGWRIEAVRGLGVPLAEGTATGEVHLRGTLRAPAVQPMLYVPAAPGELELPPGEWTSIAPLPRTSPGQVRLKVASSGNGLIALRLPPNPPAILEPADVAALLDLAATAGRCLGLTLIDAEWAITPDGQINLLQVRPLTRPAPTGAHGDDHSGREGWKGLPAAPGRAYGPTLVLTPGTAPHRVRDAVLVCGNIGPDVASAIIEHRPAAIVSTLGGPLSHAAILARELGVPCVTALPGQLAAAVIDQVLEVDGDTGTVRLATTPATRDSSQAHETALLASIMRASDPSERENRAPTVVLITRAHLPAAVSGLDPERPWGLLMTDHGEPPAVTGYTVLPLGIHACLIWPSDVPRPNGLVIRDGHTILWTFALDLPES